MIYLYNDYEEITDDILEVLVGLLPPERREKALRFRYRGGRVSCALGYLLFLYGYRKEFSGTDTPDFAIGQNEKPYLADREDVHFNISHCNQAVACIISHYPVGVDIQDVREVKKLYLDKVCSEREKERILASSNPQLEFCKLWTEKEAISKYTGDGIFRNIREISLDCTPQVMAATMMVMPEVYLTACTRVEDADFTIRKLKLGDLLECAMGR